MKHVAILALLLLTACTPREDGGPSAPSSSLTKQQALRIAHFSAPLIGGSVGTFSSTGSMLPYIDSRTIAIWEPVTESTQLHVGDIVAFDSGDISISHKVTAVQGRYVRTRGTNNTFSDNGWQLPTRRLVALFYTTK